MDSSESRIPEAPISVQQGTHLATQPVLARPVRANGALGALAVVGILLGALALLTVFGYFVAVLGVAGFVVSAVIALVPLGIVALGVRWVDTWEPEPRVILLFAFLWGAGVSVLLALIIDGEIQSVIASFGGSTDSFVFLQAAVQAPIVEETAKGLGVLLIFLVARRHFDGPVDGIVYAACIGAGFAFTENIQYFAIAILESEGSFGDIAGVFIVRGLMSPFAHVMFTALTGFAIGLAARRAGIAAGLGAFVVGLVAAILLHAFWNGALFIVPDFFGYYVLVQVPLFVLGTLFVVYLRRQEQRLTFARLHEYAATGWFNPAEVAALATATGRRTAKRWAASHGLSSQMRRYIRDSTRLAFFRQRMVTGQVPLDPQAHEAELLRAVVASRRALQGIPLR
ncbi:MULTISPECIES: PrsW family intramembrane metalloprotease [unclassified Salinibacterium]|uniref:PrsW family intramembrane metalloprotease n=1 Tax=unclassified Salinibacterium TaxID=2632331 RepID=UPI001CD810B8|nr:MULTISPECIES: PrsW family intramembrane metalloprotease [unclassified Salinibacterium]